MEYRVLFHACRDVPPAKKDYRVNDFVENLVLTVVDFMTRTKAVERAMQHFEVYAKKDAPDLLGLKALLSQYADDKVGNTVLAQRLWGYNMWTRAAMLRRLIGFFEEEGVANQEGLAQWAMDAQFKTHFEGRVKGLGYAVFNWLVMRQGVETIKPDVHILRFIQSTIGRRIDEKVAVESLVSIAKELGIPAYKLDWAIWEASRETSG
ncbi:MAG: hypothetical protein NT023_24570 [Armatimonadetes bacterium]|nr:hypothetical protein [Armatimonadota bacterium]